MTKVRLLWAVLAVLVCVGGRAVAQDIHPESACVGSTSKKCLRAAKGWERRHELTRIPLDTFIPAQPAPEDVGYVGDVYHVTVFTSAACPTCRALHGRLADYAKAGIAIRYAAGGKPGGNLWEANERVWCAADRKAAMNEGKAGRGAYKALPEVEGCDDGVLKVHRAVLKSMGVRAVPTWILPEGTKVEGAKSPKDMLRRLRQDAQAGRLLAEAGEPLVRVERREPDLMRGN